MNRKKIAIGLASLALLLIEIAILTIVPLKFELLFSLCLPWLILLLIYVE